MAVFLYDGDCAFCSRCAAVLRTRMRTPVPIMAWQRTDLAPLGVTAAECAEAVRYVHAGRVSAGPVAIGEVLRTATRRRDVGWRIAGRLLGTRPVLLVAWPVYRWVARNRHRLPGGTEACELPTAAHPAPSAGIQRYGRGLHWSGPSAKEHIGDTKRAGDQPQHAPAHGDTRPAR